MDGEEDRAMRKTGIVILLLLPALLHAEHVFELGLHGGIANWSAQTAYVDKRIGFQGGGHVYYDYFSPYVIGFRTGVTIDTHNASFGRVSYEDAYSTIDVENEQMDISYSIGDLNERYTMYSVGVPLQIALTKKGFHFLAGAKAVFPIANSWKETVKNAALSVYYPKYDNIIEESYPLAASRDFEMTQSGKQTLPTVQWWIALEAGYTIPLNVNADRHKSYVMIGVYFDYCLTRTSAILNGKESLMMLSDTRDGFPLQRLLYPVVESQRQGQQLVNNRSLFDIGIKVSYAITPVASSRRRAYPCNCLGDNR